MALQMPARPQPDLRTILALLAQRRPNAPPALPGPGLARGRPIPAKGAKPTLQSVLRLMGLAGPGRSQ